MAHKSCAGNRPGPAPSITPHARKNIMLGTAGHVDHGKTALVKLLTGCDTDRLAEEKRRGLTIELGFAPCRMADDRIVGIVDVPGHVSFIRHMVAGAHGVDVMILVVAADDGVMPQTREHLDVLTLMGVRHGLVALTKIDMVDEETRGLAVQELRDFLEGTFLADAPICPLSNITGEGFDAFFGALDQQVQTCEPRVGYGPFRQWVERSFIAHGFGVVASGIPVAGQVQAGEYLNVFPGGRRSRVRSLQVYGEDADTARVGECAAVNLSDLDMDQVPRGVLLAATESLKTVTRCAARLHLLGRLRRPLKDGSEVHLHVGTAHIQAKVLGLEGGPLAPDTDALVQLRMDRPLPLVPGDRFVVRSHVEEEGGLVTIGGGCVLDTADKPLRRKRPEVLGALANRERAIDNPDAWCLTLLAEAGTPLTEDELASRAHLLTSETDLILKRLREQGSVLAIDSRHVVAQQTIDQNADRIVEHLKGYHQTYPDRPGVSAAAVAEALAASPLIITAAVQSLMSHGTLSRQGELLALSEHRPQIKEGDQRLLDAIIATYQTDHTKPQRPMELAESLDQPVKRVEPLIRMLTERGDLVRLTDEIVMHREAVEAAVAVVRALFARADRFTTAEFRDALGASRKYVIPLLDHFDRTRLTVRHGSERKPGAKLRDNDGSGPADRTAS
jgi:selenocysteine-specific elongation factor